MWSLRPDPNVGDVEKLETLTLHSKDDREGDSVPDLLDSAPLDCDSERRLSKREEPNWCTKYLYLAAMATLLALTMWGAAVDRKPPPEHKHQQNHSKPTRAPSSSSSKVPHFLPNYTWAAILEDDSSPQSQAFAWVEAHPEFEQMPAWRIQQLMALATLFLAKTGEMPVSEDTSECQWKSHALHAGCNEKGHLTSLDLFQTNTRIQTWNLPPELALLTSLQNLGLTDGTYLTGTLPSQMGALVSLTHLSLFKNQLTGSLPSQLGLLTGLQTLVVSGTTIGSTLPRQLGALTKLQQLHLSSNKFIGSLPPWISQLEELTVLKLGQNILSGSLPTQLGQLSKLTDLSLEGNRFQGSIPTTLGGLTHLQVLQLFDNKLAGSIPTELDHATSLDAVFLHQNQLTGTVPVEVLAEWHKLEALKLQHNTMLVGSIEAEVCNGLARLTEVTIDCETVRCTCNQCRCA